jgi:hypothetical protein
MTKHLRLVFQFSDSISYFGLWAETATQFLWVPMQNENEMPLIQIYEEF